jgi:transcriptional regulator with XRE-family HTH domain
MLTARSLTRADLARRAGLNESTIGLVYRGERAMPEDWVDKIAAALRLGPADSMRLVIAGMASRLSDASAALLLSLYKTHTELEPLARDLEERIKALETYDDRLRRRESVVSDKEQAIAQREQLVAKRESLVAEREAAVRDAANEISSGMGQYWQQQGEGGDPAPSGA